MRSYRILEAASVEAMEAAAWYEQQQSGLGAEFDAAVQAALDLLDDAIVPLLPFPGRAGERGAHRLIMHTIHDGQAIGWNGLAGRRTRRAPACRRAAGVAGWR